MFRRLSLALAAAAALLLAAPAGPAASQTDRPGTPVALNTDIVVEGDTVTLDHLFSGLGTRGATPIARAPKPGKEVRLPADWLARVARAYDVDWQPLSGMQDAKLRRAAQRIDGRRIAAAVRQRLLERGVDGELRVELDTPEVALTLPVTVPGELKIASLKYDGDRGRFTVSVVAPNADRPLASATVSGDAVALIEVPVLARRVARDELISKRDILWTQLPADEVKSDHIRDPAKLVGMSARRGIRPDRPVRDTEVAPPVLVERNGLVTLILDTDRMRLTAQGRALQDGAQGDLVRVRNTKSNTTVTGTVVGDGTVAVEIGGDKAAQRE